jgi:hypothetical protein
MCEAVEVKIHAFLTSALDESALSAAYPARLILRECDASTHRHPRDSSLKTPTYFAVSLPAFAAILATY